jgi:mono/diheme cytochrome c family protein
MWQNVHIKFLGLMLMLAVSMVMSAVTTVQAQDDDDTVTLTTLSEQLEHGAINYDIHCGSCHGDTGLGFAEAKLAFPEDHRTCHYCHRRNNPPQMSMETMTNRNAFDIGEAPALRGEDTLTGFGNAQALTYYIQATMPRPFPRKLADETYVAITLHMLDLRGELPQDVLEAGEVVTLEALVHISLQ